MRVRDGVIAAVEDVTADAAGAEVVELADDEVLLPGLVDTHVHVNEPGRTEWEGFASATRAAAAGGVTTIVDMPLNSIPPTTTLAGLEAKRAAAEDQAHVDVGFWGGAVPGNVADLEPLHAAGVFGFKCFLLPSGVDEFPELNAAGLAAAMEETAAAGRAADRARRGRRARSPTPSGRDYAGFVASRPPSAERTAVERLIASAALTGARAHVVHLSAADALPAIRTARAAGVRLTVETCPHYLTLTAEEVPDGHTEFKCCPPIRDAANRDLLWEALADGTHRRRGQRPLAVRARAQALRHRRLRRGLGRHRLAPARVCRRCGPRPGAAASTWPPWSAGWPTARHGWSASTARAGSSPAPTPTCARSRRTRRSRSTPPGSGTRTPCRRTPGVRSPARSGGPGCAGRRWIRTDRREDGC